MIFNEIYGAYYKAVARILAEAIVRPVSAKKLSYYAKTFAFPYSKDYIPDALINEHWPLLKDGETPIQNEPSTPMTTLQKRWLKSVSLDPRIKLFGDIDFGLDDVEPLFYPSDVIIFDKYADGDNYEDAQYIANFRLILDAINNEYTLDIRSLNASGQIRSFTVSPRALEYSEKDDKFRLITEGPTINLGRIISCKKSNAPYNIDAEEEKPERKSITFELVDEHNALERALLHFAHFEKKARKIADGKYSVNVKYDKNDETEIVIRVLSFGPRIKVVSPSGFVDLIKQRLLDQKSCVL